MCRTCGCSEGARATITDPATGERSAAGGQDHHAHDDHHHQGGHHHHAHEHHHHHEAHHHDHGDATEPAPAEAHAGAHGTRVEVERAILADNDRLAAANRAWLARRNILALNLVSSPGAGKTTLLERTIRELGARLPISVIEGDQETSFDAERIRATGCRTVQVNTGTGCHLEAEMLQRGLQQLEPPADSVLMIENVGNLVCPALFDLGEADKVVILSVTEGADKPLKYPHMFRAAGLMVLNKTDLLPHVDFDVEACIASARRVNPGIGVLQVSAATGVGLADWYDWLQGRVAAGREAPAAAP